MRPNVPPQRGSQHKFDGFVTLITPYVYQSGRFYQFLYPLCVHLYILPRGGVILFEGCALHYLRDARYTGQVSHSRFTSIIANKRETHSHNIRK